jgi:hypothetical protein
MLGGTKVKGGHGIETRRKKWAIFRALLQDMDLRDVLK